jgi:hypothetical protein
MWVQVHLHREEGFYPMLAEPADRTKLMFSQGLFLVEDQGGLSVFASVLDHSYAHESPAANTTHTTIGVRYAGRMNDYLGLFVITNHLGRLIDRE